MPSTDELAKSFADLRREIAERREKSLRQAVAVAVAVVVGSGSAVVTWFDLVARVTSLEHTRDHAEKGEKDATHEPEEPKRWPWIR